MPNSCRNLGWPSDRGRSIAHRPPPTVHCLLPAACLFLLVLVSCPAPARAEGEWETTRESEEALARGLQWLAANQGAEGNWSSKDLGLVGMGALAFLSAGHLPEHGKYGKNVQLALDYVVRNERPSGLLNIAEQQHDMYNHGLATFVLGQAYGMTSDARVGQVLDRALKLIAETQCDDGGWQYQARRTTAGHDLSLAVMQAKALRSAVDSGLQVSPQVIELAIQGVRLHYKPSGCPYDADEETQKKVPGQFTYSRGGGNSTTAMAAAGMVCLQEFAQYDDWRIAKNLEVITRAIQDKCKPAAGKHGGHFPFDAYTLYYVGQALYQVGGQPWKDSYPLLRDALVACQVQGARDRANEGRFNGEGRVGGRPGELYFTAVACFILAMPNRYLPILQEGKIDSLRQSFQKKS